MGYTARGTLSRARRERTVVLHAKPLVSRMMRLGTQYDRFPSVPHTDHSARCKGQEHSAIDAQCSPLEVKAHRVPQLRRCLRVVVAEQIAVRSPNLLDGQHWKLRCERYSRKCECLDSGGRCTELLQVGRHPAGRSPGRPSRTESQPM